MTNANETAARRTVKVNGHSYEVANSYSCGPGCTPHTFELRGHATVRNSPIGWIIEDGRGPWQPKISGFAQVVAVEVE